MNAPINDPLILPMVSGFGKYATDRDGTTPEALTTINFYEVRDLVDKPQQGVEKDRAQWLIPSTHRSRKGHDQNGLRPLLWADVDAPAMTIQQTGDQLRDLLGGAEFEVYASSSATEEKQKCRILVPLAQALPPDQWLIVSQVFRVKLAERGIETDKASEKLGQVLYLPNEGEFYDAYSLSDSALFEPLVWWSAEIAEIELQAAEVKRAQEAARKRREALASSRSTSGFRSPIEAFNAAYDVSEVLTRNGYDQRGDSFRHPASATGSYSATVRTAADGVRRVNSLSSSDPLGGGKGAHDAFSAFCVLEHNGDRDAALRDAGDNWLTIGGESWNKVQRREWAQQQQNVERLTASSQQDSAGFDEDGVLIEPPEPKLKAVSVFDVLTNPSPPPRFIWQDYLPRGVVTLLAAHGGTGKSMIGLMLAVATATGRPLFGVPTDKSSALFVSLEDGTAIVRYRLATICALWCIDPRELEGVLHIVDGSDDPELYTADSSRGPGDKTAAYREMRDMVDAHQIGLVIVDNASDAFGGDEIQRRQVRGFVRALAEIAKSADAAVLLLAHVDKGTSRSSKSANNGEDYSGSTAWHNSVRSRIFMSRNDSGQISIKHQKANLGKKREDELILIWPNDGLPQVEQAFSGSYSADALLQRAQGRAEDEKAAALLRLMTEYEGRGEVFSPEPRANNSVFALMKADPAFKALKLGNESCKAVLLQCERAKWIERTEYRKDYKTRTRWTITADGRTFADLPQVEDKASDDVAGGGET